MIRLYDVLLFWRITSGLTVICPRLSWLPLLQECGPRPIWNRLQSWVDYMRRSTQAGGGQQNRNTHKLNIRGFTEEFTQTLRGFIEASHQPCAPDGDKILVWNVTQFLRADDCMSDMLRQSGTPESKYFSGQPEAAAALTGLAADVISRQPPPPFPESSYGGRTSSLLTEVFLDRIQYMNTAGLTY